MSDVVTNTLDGYHLQCSVCNTITPQERITSSQYRCKICYNLNQNTRFHQEPLVTVHLPTTHQGLVDAAIDGLRSTIVSKDQTNKTSGSVAAEILTTAANIVAGDRNTTHGDKERSFLVIATLWEAYLGGRKDVSLDQIRPVDVANMMVLLKIARSIQGTPVRDHYVDAAGYAAIAGELENV